MALFQNIAKVTETSLIKMDPYLKKKPYRYKKVKFVRFFFKYGSIFIICILGFIFDVTLLVYSDQDVDDSSSSRPIGSFNSTFRPNE